MQLSSVGLTISNTQSALSVLIQTSKSFFDGQAIGQMGAQASCGWPLSKENCFNYVSYWMAFFQILAKSLLVAHCHHSQS